MFISLLLVVLPIAASGTTVFTTGMRLYDFSSRLISTNILEVVESVDTETECFRHCQRDEKCVSVFYRSTQRQCQLHDVLFMSPGDGLEDNGTEYYNLNSGSCPVGYVHIRNLNYCYRLILGHTSYSECVADCQSRGEHLLVVDSQTKQNQIEKQIMASSGVRQGKYFIDGRDMETPRIWKLHDGRVMTFFNWGPFLPRVGTRNKHVILFSSDNFLWMNNPRFLNKRHICEKDI